MTKSWARTGHPNPRPIDLEKMVDKGAREQALALLPK
jgi:hypothetical protein